MIPVNIITGVLGVGKTTAIRHLLSQRPPNEKWAIVVNEFGALGIDGAVLDTAAGIADANVDGTSTTGGGDGGVVVREVAGGCLCCAVAAPFTVAVTQVLRRAKPDRLLIEPSGMGHPGGLLDALSGEFLRGALELRATVALVDVTVVASESKAELFASEAFRDQVHCADVVIGTKADLATPEEISKFREWANELYPAKAAVDVVQNGRVFLEILNVPVGAVCTPIESEHKRTASERTPAADEKKPSAPKSPPEIGSPSRALGGTNEYATAGYVFHRDEVFFRNRLIDLWRALCEDLSVVRCKGVMRVGKEWVAPAWDQKTRKVELEPVAYRRDSRIEVIVRVGGERKTSEADSLETSGGVQDEMGEKIASAGIAAGSGDWDALEEAIKAALKPRREGGK
jgi:G3E family GTPase